MIATSITWQNPERNPALSWVRLLARRGYSQDVLSWAGCSLFWDCPHRRAQACTNLHIIYRSGDRMLGAFSIPYKYVVRTRVCSNIKHLRRCSSDVTARCLFPGNSLKDKFSLYSKPTSLQHIYGFNLWSLVLDSLASSAAHDFIATFLLNNFNFKASFVATTTSIPVSFVCCSRRSWRRRGGAAALLSIICCCCSQIDYDVSTQLGITSSSTHGTGDQLQPSAPAAKSKPAVRLWSTCGSSDPRFPQSRALSATGKRVGKTPPVSSAA